MRTPQIRSENIRRTSMRYAAHRHPKARGLAESLSDWPMLYGRRLLELPGSDAGSHIHHRAASPVRYLQLP